MPEPGEPQHQTRCFPRVHGSLATAGWLERWQAQFPSASWRVTASQGEALASLIPLLLCGEQSAQLVFNHQAARLHGQGRGELVAALSHIEAEEAVHERALVALGSLFGPPGDLHQRKRRAQRFYSGLGRGADGGQHFARIAGLDRCVCRIMHSLARGAWGRSHPLFHLFEAIKDDEAGHVAVSRRCADALGVNASQRQREAEVIARRVLVFLERDAAALETLGVDAGLLFRQLRGARRV